LLANKGVSRKLAPKMDFQALSWRTKAANRYLRIMHFRLAKLLFLQRNLEFWILALQLMCKSNVLRAVALRKLNRNWHRTIKFGTVKLLLTKVERMIQDLPDSLSFTRDYVPKYKPDGTQTWRPIGNPDYPDRMFLYLWQCFLVMYLHRHIDQGQHAYRPGQGVVTAVAAVDQLLKTKPFVWEFDLKGAFPSVIIPKVCAELIEVGVPELVADYIQRMSIHTVEEVNLKEARDRGLRTTGYPIQEAKFVRQHNIRSGPLPLLAQRGLELELEMCKTRPDRFIPVEFRGFPQGAGTSPIMFNFAFQRFALERHFSKLHPSIKVISYADDFLVFSEVDLPNLWDLPEESGGLEINLDKSRLVKANNSFVVDKIKYLGVTWHLNKDPILIEGTPRSGLNLFFDKDQMVADHGFRDKQLRRFINYFKTFTQVPLTPDAVLQQWGLDERPSNLLPLAVIEGKAPVTSKLLTSIREAFAEPGVDVQARTQGVESEALASRLAQAPGWLKSRLAGLLVNRLHGGDWNPQTEHGSRSLKSPAKTEGRSWLELRMNSADRQAQMTADLKAAWAKGPEAVHSALDIIKQSVDAIKKEMSIYNSTSHATVDLLTNLKSPGTIKISKSGLRYR
jgi:hypothetical protein